MNRYPLLYPYARYRDDDEEYERRTQRKIDAEAEAERCAKHAEGRTVIPPMDSDRDAMSADWRNQQADHTNPQEWK